MNHYFWENTGKDKAWWINTSLQIWLICSILDRRNLEVKMLIIYNVFTFLRNEAELLTTSDWNEDSIPIPNYLTQFWDSFSGFPRKVFFFSSENSSESDFSSETNSRNLIRLRRWTPFLFSFQFLIFWSSCNWSEKRGKWKIKVKGWVGFLYPSG